MILTSNVAKDPLEKERPNIKDDRWIKRCINVGDSGKL